MNERTRYQFGFKKTLKFRSAELRQKNLEAILSFNLIRQCANNTFFENPILNADNCFVIYLDILSKINNCIEKNHAAFLLPRLVF